MVNKKKLLILLLIMATVLLAGVLILFLKFGQQINLITRNEKNIKLVLDSKNYDNEFIENYNVKQNQTIDVLHYNINIELLPMQKKIIGDVAVKVKIDNIKDDKILLNFYDNMKIKNVELNGVSVDYKTTATNLAIFSKSRLTDTTILRVVYEGEPKRLGFGSFNFDVMNGKPLIYTLNEPVFASTWFPCVDTPDDKALVDLYITNDSSFVSLSNGKLINIKNHGSKKTYHWKTLYPISTYLVAIYSGDYKTHSQKYVSLSKDTLDLFCFALPNKFNDAVHDFSDHPNYLRVFEEIFGFYPFIKEKYSMAQFNWAYGAMEHQTITGIGTDYISGKKFFQDMIIHELAHQWWGNAVGPKTWKDIWLNEGFSTYSEALYWERTRGFSALQTTLAAKFGSFEKGTLYNPEVSLFSTLVYDKGAWVLHMLRKEVGDSAFFAILRNYFEKFKYKNASTSDFQKVSEDVSKKNLKTFFDQWVFKGEGIIEAVCQFSVLKTEGGYRTKIDLKQLQNSYDIYKFPLDIKFISLNENQIGKFYISKREETIYFETKFKPTEFVIDPDKWLLAKFEVITEKL